MVRMLEPLSTALAATDCSLLVRVGKAMSPGTGAWEGWSRVTDRELRRGGLIDALTSEDRRVMDALFIHLGETGREQQEQLLGETIAGLGKQLEAAEAGARESERLCLSLGLLTGLMLALVVI